MIVVVFVMLTLLCILFCCANNSKVSVNHVVVLILTIYQFMCVKGNVTNSYSNNFFSYPISYWIGFFWASIVAVIVSFYTFIKETHEKTKDEENK